MQHQSDMFAKNAKQKMRKRDIVGAISDWTQAITLSPDNSEYYLERGVCYFNADKYELAVEDISKVIQISTNNEELYEAYDRRALCHDLLGEHDKALNDLIQTLIYDNSKAFIYTRLGYTRMKLNQFALAANDYFFAFSLSGEEDDLLQQGIALAKASHNQKAMEIFHQLIINGNIDNFIKLAGIHNWLGKVYLADNQPDLALQEFDKTLVINDNIGFPDTLFYRGLTLEKLNRHQEALEDFRRGNQIDENHPDAPRIKSLLMD